MSALYSWDTELVSPASGRDQQGVVSQWATFTQVEDPFHWIQSSSDSLGKQGDALLLVPFAIANHHLLLQQKPLQESRQRYPVVERVRLIGEQPDVTREVVLSQHLRAGRSGDTIADNDVLFADFSSQICRSSLRRDLVQTNPGR